MCIHIICAYTCNTLYIVHYCAFVLVKVFCVHLKEGEKGKRKSSGERK